jgi:hypothetical protein
LNDDSTNSNGGDRGTGSVVVKGKKPMYVSTDREKAKEVARELDSEWDEEVELWNNVTYEI